MSQHLRPIVVPSVPFRKIRDRVSLACRQCRQRKVKCETNEDPPRTPCKRCVKKNLICEYVYASDDPDVRREQEQFEEPLASSTMQTRTVQSSAFPSQFSQGQLPARDVYGRVQYLPSDSATRHPYSAPCAPTPEQSMAEQQGQYYSYSAPQTTTNFLAPSTYSQSQYGMPHYNPQTGQPYSNQRTDGSFAYPSNPPTGEQAYYWPQQGTMYPNDYYQRRARAPTTIMRLTSSQHELHLLPNTMYLQPNLLSSNPLTALMIQR